MKEPMFSIETDPVEGLRIVVTRVGRNAGHYQWRPIRKPSPRLRSTMPPARKLS